MSRAGDRGPAGFTLVELLVVLAIVGLALGVAVPFFRGGATGPGLDALAGDLAATLREARGQAILGNREAVVLVDPGSRSYRLDPDGAVAALPADVVVTLTVAATEMVSDQAGGIRFFADGSSTGGTVELAHGARRIAVRVDWLSGRVRTGDGA